jgi:multiple sugar transport system permease protein
LTTRRRRAAPWLEPLAYLAPALILLAAVMFVPLAIGLSYAFRNIQVFDPFETGWVGLQHFRELRDDPAFWNAALNTAEWTFSSLALQFSLGFGLALLLRRPFRGRRMVQAVVFVPWAVPTFLSGLAWAWLFNPLIGPLPHWLTRLGLMAKPENILASPDIALIGPIVANVWFGIPFFAITLLAGLVAIPPELYEAAEVDGASAWQRFSRLTLPFLAPTIAITLMLRTIWIANFADLIWVMTNGGPADSTQTLSTYIFSTAYAKLDFGYASAIAAVLLLVLLLYGLTVLRLRRSLLVAA